MGQWSIKCAKCRQRYGWQGSPTEAPPCPGCHPHPLLIGPSMDDDAASDAIELCNDILELCDEVPEAGEEFADGVREKTENIREWIVQHGMVTPAQLLALGNMDSGLRRWVRD